MAETVDYLTLDVFTNERFCGNPLAVVPHAEGLTTGQMQTLAAEFNYSESTFVTGSPQPDEFEVRIFTPKSELPFAGHPTIGTAIALRNLGRTASERITLHEKAGPVPVTFIEDDRGRFQAPGPIEVKPIGSVGAAATALSLDQTQILSEPQQAGAGLGFPFVEVADESALSAIQLSNAETLFRDEVAVFCQPSAENLSVRVFAPGHGIPEDPATGSAAAALAGLLATRHGHKDGRWRWTIKQGVDMGRSSEIVVEAIKQNGQVDAIFVEGAAVAVAEGRIRI